MNYGVGDELPPFEIEAVDPEAMKQWAVFLADPNQIHLDVEFVKAKGLGDKVINQGPINVAYMMNCLLSAFPGGKIEKMTSRFLDNVYGGERVIARGVVEAVDNGSVVCALRLESEERGLVNTASATVLLPQVRSRQDSGSPLSAEPETPISWLAWLMYPKA